MTVTNNGILYTVQIVTKHFGNLVAKVCETLLKSGPLNLANLIRSTALTPQQVKNSLLILVQHNCVQPFTQESNVGLKVQYVAVYDNILHRLRFAKFLAVVAQELGDDCKQLVAGLLEHGRLTQQQLMDTAGQKAKSSSGEVQNDVHQENFVRLVNACFVEHCPAPEPLLEEPSEQDGPKKPHGKSAKMAQVPETIEQRVLAAARPIEAIRFLIATDAETDDPLQASENNSSTTSFGEKRKFDDVDEEHASKDKEVIIWRANFEQFIRCLRHKAGIVNVRARYDDGAAVVLRAVLKTTRNQETKVKTDYSVSLKMDAIYNEVMDSEAGYSLEQESVRAHLRMLCGAPLVTGEYEDENEDGDVLYSVDLKKIIELLQNDEVESIVVKRYGRDAYRIFRLLTSQSNAGRFFETDKISEMALVDKKETPKILYKSWKDDYVNMEKLSVMAAKQSQIMVWKVHKSIVWEHVLDEMYHAAYNLVKRYDHEREENKEVLDTRKENRIGELEKKVNRFLAVRKIMTTSLLKLDDAPMLFHDF